MQKFRLINIKFALLKVLLSIFIILTLNSCDTGCVEADKFDTASTYVNSKPVTDGITGTSYPSSVATWHDTGFRSDGSALILYIKGGWTAWEEASNNTQLNSLSDCEMCAKKSGVSNCICATGETPTAEKDDEGNAYGIDCSTADGQNSTKCSCTKQNGLTTDSGVYWIATNYQNKDETLKSADNQEACRYTAGSGLYVGLFGKDGTTVPSIAYPIYPTTELCDITRNAAGKCIDSSGEDQTKYYYISPNKKVFMKDETSYHQSGEYYKLIIDDNWYWDNYGGYEVEFAGGFLKSEDSGLLEYIVGTVEDSFLGTEVDGTRVGGAVNFLYNSIVKDSSFIRIVQLLLVVYVVLFGIGVLIGTVEISRKDLISRIIKISLIIAFTTPTSWYFYNQIVVGFFKDGMDYLIAIFMKMSDKTMDQTTLTSIVNTQLDVAKSSSYATRFSYIDFVIKKLLSSNTSKKIWSLFFGEWFGVLYIPVIYALIFAFVYVMLTAAFVYIAALLRLIFVLCLGPIFMVTLLFNKTDEIFKRWISFMASQAIEIVCLFLVIYLFLVLIDVAFSDLLYFKACSMTWSIGLTTFTGFMKSELSRTLPQWLAMFLKIATLLFLLKMIMDKIPGFAGQLVSVSGMKADNSSSFVSQTNKSAFALAGSVLGMAGSAAKTALVSGVPFAVSNGISAARFINRNTGIGDSIYSAVQSIPFRGLTSRYRDHKIDNVIRQKQKEGKAKGLSGAFLDQFVRSETFKEINKQDEKSHRTNNILGISDNEFILKRLDAKLIKEPLKDFIRNATKEIKKEQGSNVPLDRDEMKEAVRAKVSEWASKNSSVSPDQFTKLLDKGSKSVKSVLKKESALTSYEATKAFAGNKEGKDRYLEHLEQEQIKKEEKSQKAWESGKISGAFNAAKNAFRAIEQKNAYNPEFARQNFLSKSKIEEEYKNTQKVGRGLGNYFAKSLTGKELPEHKIGSYLDKTAKQSFANRVYNRDTLNNNAEGNRKLTLEKYLLNDGYKKDLENIDKKYAEELKNATPEGKKELQKAKDNDLKKAEKKNTDFKKSLEKLMKKEEEKAKKDIENSLKRNLKEEEMKSKKESLSDLTSSNEKKLFLLGQVDKKVNDEDTIKMITDLKNNAEGKISDLEKKPGEKMILKDRLELDKLKSEKEMLDTLLKSENNKIIAEKQRLEKEKKEKIEKIERTKQIILVSHIKSIKRQELEEIQNEVKKIQDSMKKLEKNVNPQDLNKLSERIKNIRNKLKKINDFPRDEAINKIKDLEKLFPSVEKQNLALRDYFEKKQNTPDSSSGVAILGGEKQFENKGANDENKIKENNSENIEKDPKKAEKDPEKDPEKQPKKAEVKDPEKDPEKEPKKSKDSEEETKKADKIPEESEADIKEKKREKDNLENQLTDLQSELKFKESKRSKETDEVLIKILEDQISGLKVSLQSIKEQMNSKK